ncbi:Solute carrier family 2, facilitated glucose transporter member 9 [Liparis tanakae]|uniref:Solute carrier family 2, facilitated glucose transporter member 9 n=1 Tax=Liparis tanakae TaxID=230148 RepID=A0A4Z2FU75_9TELE|nr:Solute carrier family 2, facilitated glucose transporter member 9 [Liparis tanakae]
MPSGILREAGFDEELLPYITLSTGAIETLAAIISGLVIERIGRKPLLIFGFLAMAVFYSLLTVFLKFQDSQSWMPYLSYACILAVIASFCSGPVQDELRAVDRRRNGEESEEKWRKVEESGEKWRLKTIPWCSPPQEDACLFVQIRTGSPSHGAGNDGRSLMDLAQLPPAAPAEGSLPPQT